MTADGQSIVSYGAEGRPSSRVPSVLICTTRRWGGKSCCGDLVAASKFGKGRVSRTRRLRTTVRNCTRDEGGPFEAGSQVQVSSHELLSSRAMVVSVAETSGHDPGRQG